MGRKSKKNSHTMPAMEKEAAQALFLELGPPNAFTIRPQRPAVEKIFALALLAVEQPLGVGPTTSVVTKCCRRR